MGAKFVEEQPMAGREVAVSAGLVVGRTGADIELADPEVSRRHAIFRQVDSGLGVEDLGSRNGTYVNERRVDGIVAVADGDSVRFGNTVWRLGTDSGAGQTRPAAASARPAAPRDPDRPPTGIRQAISAEPVYGEALPTFDPTRAPSPVLGRSAARRIEATLFSYGVVIATAIAVVAYFIQR